MKKFLMDRLSFIFTFMCGYSSCFFAKEGFDLISILCIFIAFVACWIAILSIDLFVFILGKFLNFIKVCYEKRINI